MLITSPIMLIMYTVIPRIVALKFNDKTVSVCYIATLMMLDIILECMFLLFTEGSFQKGENPF